MQSPIYEGFKPKTVALSTGVSVSFWCDARIHLGFFSLPLGAVMVFVCLFLILCMVIVVVVCGEV